MKAFITIAVVVWLACGLAGLWMLDYDHLDIWAVAKGPFTLARAFSDAPAQARVR